MGQKYLEYATRDSRRKSSSRECRKEGGISVRMSPVKALRVPPPEVTGLLPYGHSVAAQREVKGESASIFNLRLHR